MKLTIKLLLASVVAIGAMNSGLRADSVSVSNQAVTLALTTKTAAPGTFEVDPDTGKLTKIPAFESTVETLKDGNVTKSVYTEATKAITGKYGNKELLESIKDDMLDGIISGWSIQVDSEGAVLAVKSGQDSVDLSELLALSPAETEFGSYIQTTSNTYNADGDVTSTKVATTAKGTVEGAFGFTILGADVVGAFTGAFTGLPYFPNNSVDSPDKTYQDVAYIPGAGKITGIIGEGVITNNDVESSAIVAGTASIAAAKGTIVKD